MIITNEWLINNTTKSGGYTRVQLALLGVNWPPVSGWKKNVVDTEVDDNITHQFEQISQQSKNI